MKIEKILIIKDIRIKIFKIKPRFLFTIHGGRMQRCNNLFQFKYGIFLIFYNIYIYMKMPNLVKDLTPSKRTLVVKPG